VKEEQGLTEVADETSFESEELSLPENMLAMSSVAEKFSDLFNRAIQSNVEGREPFLVNEVLPLLADFAETLTILGKSGMQAHQMILSSLAQQESEQVSFSSMTMDVAEEVLSHCVRLNKEIAQVATMIRPDAAKEFEKWFDGLVAQNANLYSIVNYDVYGTFTEDSHAEFMDLVGEDLGLSPESISDYKKKLTEDPQEEASEE
jgi:hypothetical protein